MEVDVEEFSGCSGGHLGTNVDANVAHLTFNVCR